MAKTKWPPSKKYPLVEGTHRLTEDWTVDLPDQFARRIENGSLVLWRPGFTIWLDAFGNDHRSSRSTRLKEIRSKISETATDLRETSDPHVTRLAYRLRDRNPQGPVESVNAFVFSETGHLQVAVYFDSLADESVAFAIADSIRFSR